MISLLLINIPTALMKNTHQATTENSKEKVAMLVPNSIYLQLKTRLERYIDDVTEFDVMIYNGSWSDPSEVRTEIQAIHSAYNVCGAILVGDIPISYYRTGETPYGVRTFPTDLYYMDLDGVWTDDNSDWIFENRSDPEGVDIWVSRLKPPESNITLLEDYFDKNHLYRSTPIDKHNALVFEDAGDPFGPMRVEVLKTIYNETDIVVIYMENETTKSNYINALKNGYEALWMSSHGAPTAEFILEPNGTYSHFRWHDAKSIVNGSVFYLLHNCEVGRYDVENYLAGWYIFGNSNGLVALASTTLWESIDHDFFIYENENSYIGKAFLETIKHADNIARNDTHPEHKYVIRCLYYGAVLIGDPLISIGYREPGPEPPIPVHMDLVEGYFPIFVFDEEEKFYPTSFYYDDNDITNNPSNYDESWPLTVYVHTVEYGDTKDHLCIQYWFYFANDTGKVIVPETPWTDEITFYPHPHDWESVYVFLKKEGTDYIPKCIAYFHHAEIWVDLYSLTVTLEDCCNVMYWENPVWEPDKINGTHPVVHVARNSHASYPHTTLDYAIHWTVIGVEPGHDIVKKTPVPIEPCNGGLQIGYDEFQIIYVDEPDASWPNQFGDIEAPWNRDRWDKPEDILLPYHIIKNSFTMLSLNEPGSKLYLHVYDNESRHVGFNRETSEIETEIPGSYYEDKGNTTFIILPENMTDFEVTVDGKDAHEYVETYELVISSIIDDELVDEKTIEDTIEQGKTQDFNVKLGLNRKITIEIPEEPAEEPDQESDEESDQESGDSNPFSIYIGVAIAVAAVVVLMIIVLKRRKAPT